MTSTHVSTRRRNLTMGLSVLAGSFLLYCGGQVAQDLVGDGGIVNEADAQAETACCETALPTRTSIQEGNLPPGESGQAVDVRAFTSVILYVPGNCVASVPLVFSHLADDTAIVVNRMSDDGGQAAVLGDFVRVVGQTNCTDTGYRLVGVR